MARIKQGILGGFSGKVGGVVGSSWKGIAVMKAKPLSVANPKTAGQVAQRGLFSKTSKIASLILAAIVKPLNDKFAQAQSGYNAFVSRNINFLGTLPFTTPALITISKGSLLGFASPAAAATAGDNTVELNWMDNSGQGKALATDVLYYQVWDVNTGLSLGGGVTSDVRSDVSASVVIVDVTAADDIVVSITFLAADGSVVSTGESIEVTVQSAS